MALPNSFIAGTLFERNKHLPLSQTDWIKVATSLPGAAVLEQKTGDTSTAFIRLHTPKDDTEYAAGVLFQRFSSIRETQQVITKEAFTSLVQDIVAAHPALARSTRNVCEFSMYCSDKFATCKKELAGCVTANEFLNIVTKSHIGDFVDSSLLLVQATNSEEQKESLVPSTPQNTTIAPQPKLFNKDAVRKPAVDHPVQKTGVYDPLNAMENRRKNLTKLFQLDAQIEAFRAELDAENVLRTTLPKAHNPGALRVMMDEIQNLQSQRASVAAKLQHDL